MIAFELQNRILNFSSRDGVLSHQLLSEASDNVGSLGGMKKQHNTWDLELDHDLLNNKQLALYNTSAPA